MTMMVDQVGSGGVEAGCRSFFRDTGFAAVMMIGAGRRRSPVFRSFRSRPWTGKFVLFILSWWTLTAIVLARPDASNPLDPIFLERDFFKRIDFKQSGRLVAFAPLDVASVFLASAKGDAGILFPSTRGGESCSIRCDGLKVLRMQSPAIGFHFRQVIYRPGQGSLPSEIQGRMVIREDGDVQYFVDDSWPLMAFNSQALPAARTPYAAFEYSGDEMVVFSSDLNRGPKGEVIRRGIKRLRPKSVSQAEDVAPAAIPLFFYRKCTLEPIGLCAGRKVPSIPLRRTDPQGKLEVSFRREASGRVAEIEEKLGGRVVRRYKLAYHRGRLRELAIEMTPVKYAISPHSSCQIPSSALRVVVKYAEEKGWLVPRDIVYTDDAGPLMALSFRDVAAGKYIPLASRRDLADWNPYPDQLDLFSYPPAKLRLVQKILERRYATGNSYRVRSLLIIHLMLGNYREAEALFAEHIAWLKANSARIVVAAELAQMIDICYESLSRNFGRTLIRKYLSQLPRLNRAEYLSLAACYYGVLFPENPALLLVLAHQQFRMCKDAEDRKFYAEAVSLAINGINEMYKERDSYTPNYGVEKLLRNQLILKDYFGGIQ
ncbi:MAG: hypothetical protein D6820_05530, partial [Lentisphaerae bacterium]